MAALAVLMMVLAPLLSPPPAAGRSGQEVCTAQGSKWIEADAGAPDQPGPKPLHQHLDHCPCCLLGLGALGLPPAGLQLVVPGVLVRDLPSALPAVPRTVALWRKGLARSPPLRA
jgi:hypothetical protein